MSMKKRYVKSIAKMMHAYNLVSKDEKGNRLSIHLARGDVSRALTEEEFQSLEVQNGSKRVTSWIGQTG